MNNIIRQLEETTAWLRARYTQTPTVGIVLGSGLGNFATHIKAELEIPYEEIPHFPVSTVEGHHGRLIFGEVNGKKVVAMAGRFHFYEGYTPEQVVFPIRLMKFLGVQQVLISNAAGGVNPAFAVGDLMVITDHISFAIINPLLGKNEKELGPRFPDMSEPYNKGLVKQLKEIAAANNIKLQQGVYFGVTGPTFETRAEYLLIHRLGGDAVGMSTVQEVIAAIHTGMQVVAVSVITDLGIREEDNVITHEEVLEAAAAAEPKLTTLFTELIGKLP
ncbi:purine-nucleoside phosphorylase [Pseudoflavitalea sp. G-6-1-2]|uniref:purine-nucleoside phosphorylase n=1 Tax=Pseudoflavitalea sp. G-6-1-2 TaxID=2728841 RepID=UPI00197EC950|nr:purine-nucleoside phosphorylase [Pseudoflavitalea sp. G-6-1-2]